MQKKTPRQIDLAGIAIMTRRVARPRFDWLEIE
jgi:hypothetical protein